jgi:NAD(P)-dependent dehydrogenase (short-subunit alcohol dehydrogenase family)
VNLQHQVAVVTGGDPGVGVSMGDRYGAEGRGPALEVTQRTDDKVFADSDRGAYGRGRASSPPVTVTMWSPRAGRSVNELTRTAETGRP